MAYRFPLIACSLCALLDRIFIILSIDFTSSSVQASKESFIIFVVYIYIYIIYTPNLGSGIAVFVQEREQGRFKGSSEGARGAAREH